MNINNLPPDPWNVLGLATQTVDKADIRSAYRKRVLQCHPDKVQDEALKAKKQEEFQAVQQAYELLNNDVERGKYTDLRRLAQLRKQAEELSRSKISPNTSSRRSSRTYVLRTAEPSLRTKTFSVPVSKQAFRATFSSVHSRSDEDVPTRPASVFSDIGGERRTRRSQSYDHDIPSRRDEEKRESDERRRRRNRGDDYRDRDRERERDRDRAKETMEREATLERERQVMDAIRKAEKKARERERERVEKERDKLRRQGAEEKARSHRREPYIEEMPKVEEKSYLKDEKRSSSSRKYDDNRERERERPRERDKSSPRRTKSPSPVSELPTRDKKVLAEKKLAYAASYIHVLGTVAPQVKRTHLASDPFTAPPSAVPSPSTPADAADDTVRRGARKATWRRASLLSQRPGEKPAVSRSASAEYNVVDVEPPRIPSMSKTYSSPPVIPVSPPRGLRRSKTDYTGAVPDSPAFSRSQTWTAYADSRPDGYLDNADERNRTSRTGYKVEGGKTVKMSTDYFMTSHPAPARYGPDTIDAGEAYVGKPWKVKTARYDNVAYSQVPHSYYAPRATPYLYS